MRMASRETMAGQGDRREVRDEVEALLRHVPAGRPRWFSREFMLGALSGVALPMVVAALAMWLLHGETASNEGFVVRPAAWLLALATVIAGLALALALSMIHTTRRQRRANAALHELALARLTGAEGSLAGLEASRSSSVARPDMARSATLDRAVIRLQLQQIQRYLAMAGNKRGAGTDSAAVPGVVQSKA